MRSSTRRQVLQGLAAAGAASVAWPSEPGGYSAIARDREFGRRFLIRRADQLLFGTDFLMPDQKIPHFALYDSLDLPDDVQQKLYRGNAIRLLKLDDAGD